MLPLKKIKWIRKRDTYFYEINFSDNLQFRARAKYLIQIS